MVIEAGVMAGYMIAWAVRKARRAAGRADTEVDLAIDTAMDKLHEAVTAKLGAHPALDDLTEEAAADGGQVSELTRQQVELALIAAARKDQAFASQVTALLASLQSAERASAAVVAGAGAKVFTGNANAQASGNGIAFGQVGGDVRIDRGSETGAQPDPTQPGRSGH